MFGGDEDDDVNNDIHVGNNEENILGRPKACGVLQFHNGTEEAMFLFIKKQSEEGDVHNIIKAIDEFCYNRHWMMHLGDRKSKYLEDHASQVSSRSSSLSYGECCVELGSYCGYSALRIGRMLSLKGKLICIEKEPQCVSWTKRLIEYAGLTSKVIVLQGTVESLLMNSTLQETLQANRELQENALPATHFPFQHEVNASEESPQMQQQQQCSNHQSLSSSTTIDLLFIDHDKASYKSDLQLLFQYNLLASGCTVIADNILSFNQPMYEYMEYVKDPLGPFQSSITIQDYVEYSVPSSTSAASVAEVSAQKPSEKFLIDALEISIVK